MTLLIDRRAPNKSDRRTPVFASKKTGTTRKPSNLPRGAFKYFGHGVPNHLRPSAIETWLVCGPPAAGKSTLVSKLKRTGDVEISLDECKRAVGGRLWDTDRQVLRRALAMRDGMLRSLSTATRGKAYVIIGAPTAHERSAWCKALGITADHVTVLATPAEVCIARLHADPAREHARAGLINGVQRWHWLHSRDAA